MALSKPSLKQRIHDNLVAKFGAAYNDAYLQDYAEAMADAIIDEITANAVVVPGSFTNGGGPVTGTGQVT